MREFEVEKLAQAGRILPMFKDEVIAFATSLDDSQTVSFSAAGEATTRKPCASIPDGYKVDKSNSTVAFAAERVARVKGHWFVDAANLVM